MNFNAGIKSISISSHAKKVFQELDAIRPKHISFSLMLAIAADEYIKNHNKGLVKLDDFSTECVNARIPHIMAEIGDWVNYVSSISLDDLKSLGERILQLQNVMDKRNEFIH